MKPNNEFKSRFRILKGGKISLVVSALLVGSVATTDLVADVTTDLTTLQEISGNANYTVTSSGSIVVTDSTSSTIVTDAVKLNQTANGLEPYRVISNAGTISAVDTDSYAIGLHLYTSTNIYGLSFSTNYMSEIQNSGTISATGETGALAINLSQGHYGYMTNDTTGSINATSQSGYAFGIRIGNNSAGSFIENRGTITVDAQTQANGIHVEGAFVGSISNSGTISSTSATAKAYGVTVKNDVGGSGITNSGTITANASLGAYGIKTGDNYSLILNEGDINATSSSSNAYGIEIRRNDGEITNDGSISVESTTSATGIRLGENNYGSITNSGTITAQTDAIFGTSTVISVNGNNSGSIQNDGTINAIAQGAHGSAGGILVNFANESGATIINRGNINAHAPSSTISVVTGIQSNSDNNGTVTNLGNIDVSGGSWFTAGITFSEDINGDINNSESGSITVESGSGGFGIIAKNLNSTGTITNDGDINVTTSYSNANGIKLSYDMNGTIINNGSITVASGNDKAFGIHIGNESNGEITNSGTITATSNSVASKLAYSLYSTNVTDHGVTFENTSTGVMNGNIKFNGTLTNAGTISLPYDATGGQGYGSAYVKNFTNSGTLQIGLSTNGTTTTHSQLLTDTATFEDGSTIDVNVLNTSTNVNLLAGETLNNVVDASTLTINGTLNVTDNSALLNFEYVEDGETIDLNVVEAKTIFDSAVLGGAQTNTKKSARVLQNINDNISQYSQMAPVMDALNELETDGAVAQAVESTTPQSTGATVGAASQISNGIAGIVEQRQNITMGGGLNSGDEMFANKNIWIKPFASFGTQNDKDGINGFDIKAYGLGMGIDGEYKNNHTLGFAFFYTAASVDVNNISQKSDLDVFTTLVYGNRPIIDDKTRFMYQLGYAWQKTNGQRSVFTGDTAKSDYTSKTASLDLKLLRNYQVNDRLLLQPMLETTYRHFTSPSYSESDAGALSLDVQKFTSNELIVGLGSIAHYKLDEKSKIVGNVNVGYDLRDEQQSVTASYQGASSVSFDTDGIDNGRFNYDLGVGYERDINEYSNINISYNRQGQGTDFTNNTLSAKYVLNF